MNKENMIKIPNYSEGLYGVKSQNNDRKKITTSTRDKVLERQRGICAGGCGTNFFRDAVKIDIHHKDGNRNNNNIDNLEALCPNCHARISREQKNKANETKSLTKRGMFTSEVPNYSEGLFN